MASVIENVAIRDAIGIYRHFRLCKLFSQKFAVIGKQRVAIHKRDDHLAETFLRNHDRRREAFISSPCRIELHLVFVFAASVIVFRKRSNARFHFAEEHVFLFAAKGGLYNDGLATKHHRMRDTLATIIGRLAKHADNARLALKILSLGDAIASRKCTTQQRKSKCAPQ